MTALPKTSGIVEDHPPCRKTLNCGRFLWISAAEKNTSPGEAKARGKTRSKEGKRPFKGSRCRAKHLVRTSQISSVSAPAGRGAFTSQAQCKRQKDAVKSNCFISLRVSLLGYRSREPLIRLSDPQSGAMGWFLRVEKPQLHTRGEARRGAGPRRLFTGSELKWPGTNY